MMPYIVFQYDCEPILIRRELIGLEAIMENELFDLNYKLYGCLFKLIDKLLKQDLKDIKRK